MTNQRTIDLIVCFMGLMGLASIAAAVYLVSVNQPVPEQIWLIVSGVIVGLPSLLASTRSTGDQAQDVNIAGQDEPVVTKDVKK